MKPLSGQLVVLTGASGSLGGVAAKALAAEGATMVLVGRRLSRLEAVYDQILALGAPTPVIHPTDLATASEDDFKIMADAIKTGFGRLDGLVHLAADFEALRPLKDLDGSRWLRSITVNLTAPILLTRSLLPLMIESGGGRVVFTDDSSSQSTSAFFGPYGVAKAGLRQFAGALEAEMGGFGIHAACFTPGPVQSDLRRRIFAGESQKGLASAEAAMARLVELFDSSFEDTAKNGVI